MDSFPKSNARFNSKVMQSGRTAQNECNSSTLAGGRARARKLIVSEVEAQARAQASAVRSRGFCCPKIQWFRTTKGEKSTAPGRPTRRRLDTGGSNAGSGSRTRRAVEMVEGRKKSGSRTRHRKLRRALAEDGDGLESWPLRRRSIPIVVRIAGRYFGAGCAGYQRPGRGLEC